ncbi:MAG: alpha/beta fold hydrolase, partial [Deltaproteobacteria bacterium]|nr:alpha/beta fold hydrolase [Deltaproteobacteria bacterium]
MVSRITDVQRFEPARWAPGGDLQTIVGYFLPSPRTVPLEQRYEVSLEDGDRLLIVENAPDEQSPQPTVALVVHGLGGDTGSPYMRRLAARFTEAGFVCARMNMRGAGEGSSLASGMYNAGRSDDLAAVIDELCRRHPSSALVIVGCSISGNVLLKYLGEPEHRKPDSLVGSIAICPPIDLADCAAHLSKWRNSLYGLKFVTLLRLDARRHPGLPVDPKSLDLVRPMTLLEFDDLATAPAGGFDSGQDYYAHCSAMGFVGKIETPTLILAADDDPFIPVRAYHALRVS